MESVDQIELHDSVVQVSSETNDLLLELRPAYVHHWRRVAGEWRGTGRTQAARIRLTGGQVAPNPPLPPTEIAGGWIRVGEDFYDGLLPAPLSRVGVISAHLELVNAESMDLVGTAIAVELVGPFEDIEELPADWAPVRGAV